MTTRCQTVINVFYLYYIYIIIQFLCESRSYLRCSQISFTVKSSGLILLHTTVGKHLRGVIFLKLMYHVTK